ncbi:MAG: hypothetical protein OEU26_12905 [Candidatus Tectomicrobia bacterium]|nr:hypothetical protein [Candidatus Tectomicrobia bacterium]
MSKPDVNPDTMFGPQGMIAEDRTYKGSRYADVREALFANPYRDGAAGQKPGPLPMFKSRIRNAWRGLFFGENIFRQASARVIDSRADLRWGEDGKGYRRIIAPNGICVLGTWEITEDNPFTGYFTKGSKGIVIGRVSSDGNETKRGQRRSISLGLKIYPTTDVDHKEPLIPASVIVQEDLGGMRTAYINDAELMNAPSIHAYRRGIFVLIMLRANSIFTKLDKVAGSRQVSEVAELGKPADVQTIAPKHMLLKMAPGQRKIEGARLDFREEIYQHIYEGGTDEPTGAMEFDISVADYGRETGLPAVTTMTVNDWHEIGKMRWTEAVASYNGDHVIHFHHPGWRDDRNDPSTYIRHNEVRCRR